MNDNTTRATGSVPTARVGRSSLWLIATVAVFLGLFYAYDIWAAVGNLVGLNQVAQRLSTQLNGFGWTLLIAGVLAPAVVYAIAFWLGRNRGAGVLGLYLLVGLCLVAALSADIYIYAFHVGGLIV